MKKLIIYSLCFCLCSIFGSNLSANANKNDPKVSSKSETLFGNKYVKLNGNKDDLAKNIALVSYNENNEYFSLKSFKEVKFIQILNSHGELEYQLPINNSLVHLALSDFAPGLYTVNLLFEGESEYLEMDLSVN